MFDFIEQGINNVLDITDNLLSEGELPSKKQLSQLISDGLTVAAISSAIGVSEDILENLLKEVDKHPIT